MKRISKVAGAIETGAGGRSGFDCGGSAVVAAVAPPPTGGCTKRSNSSAGHVVKCPKSWVRKPSAAGHLRKGRRRLLTIGARCSVISPDCIQNVDTSQLQVLERLPAKPLPGANQVMTR